MANFSLEEEANTVVNIEGSSVEKIDPETGKTSHVSYEKKEGRLLFPVHLPPGGSYMVYIHKKRSVASAIKQVEQSRELVSAAESKAEMLHPNVLTLDYVNLKLMGENKGNMFYAEASDMIYKRFGYETGNPWNIVQYKTVFLDQNKLHKEGENFETGYFFNIKPGLDMSNIKVVVEQAKYYNITLNGQKLEPDEETWLDPDFNCIDIGEYARIGKNELKLSMRRFDNRCDPSPVYVLGNFSLRSVQKGWEIIPLINLGIGSWKNHGFPFYSESVKYSKNVDLDKSGDFEIELTEWNGTVAEVLVNGTSMGVIQSQPYNKKIKLGAGNNEVSVVVYGSLKNVFGPHHVINRGFMRPPAFRKGKEIMPAGNEYDLLDYGLFEDFEIYRINQEIRNN